MDFIAPDWVLVTRNGPVAFSAWQNDLKDPTSTNTNYVVGRYAFAVYDEGGLIDVNIGGFPNYANLTRPTRPTRRLAPKYPEEESEIMLAVCHAVPQTLTVIRTPQLEPREPRSPIRRRQTMVRRASAQNTPHGLTVNPSTGLISGIPTSPGVFNITLSASNGVALLP